MMPRRPFPAFLAILFSTFQGISSAKPAFPVTSTFRMDRRTDFLSVNFLLYGVA